MASDDMSSEQLARLIAADRQRRATEAQQRIAAILGELNCDLVAQPFIEDGRILAVVQIVPK